MSKQQRTPKAKQEEPKEKKPTIDSVAYTKSFFESNKEYHFNNEEESDDYLVSSGSLILDSYLGGGFARGVHRFVGANEGGKTNEALHVMYNMMDTVPDTKGLYIKAEGRLSKDIQERSGLKFIYNPEEWEVGTCLVFECNIADVVFDYLRGLLRNNPSKTKFCIVIDSMDGLLPKSEIDKSTSDAAKVAAGALMTSDFLKRVSLGMSKFGHLCIMISQIRSKIDASAYTKADPNNQTNSSGGNAALHYPDWILEFQKQYKQDKILEKQDDPISPDNPIYGHNAKVLICKSTNETTGNTVKYPIKHGRIGGKSIWIEREIVEMLLMYAYIEKKGSWFNADAEIIKFAEDNSLVFPTPVQGMKNLYGALEKDEALTKILKTFVRENCLKR